jgi:hypothetical protein
MNNNVSLGGMIYTKYKIRHFSIIVLLHMSYLEHSFLHMVI